jgi:starvation-inducible DNA-binding protein
MDDSDADALSRQGMLAELRDHNQLLCTYMRDTRTRRNNSGDVETASLLENWIDEAEQRVLFLTATSQDA